MTGEQPLTAEQIAQAIRDETLSFEDGLIYHLLFNLGIAIEDLALFMGLTLAIGRGNMGQFDEVVELPTGPSTVKDIIERFQLSAFMETFPEGEQ